MFGLEYNPSQIALPTINGINGPIDLSTGKPAPTLEDQLSQQFEINIDSENAQDDKVELTNPQEFYLDDKLNDLRFIDLNNIGINRKVNPLFIAGAGVAALLVGYLILRG